MSKREVVLHSMDPAAIENTRSTLAFLGGSLTVEDGRAYVEGPEFTFWAAERQGYVARVIRDDPLPY